MTILYSYTAESFADPLNTVEPPSTGAVGLVPAYGLLDISATIRIGDQVTIRASGNNLTNKSYFTKRPAFYPGPGIWPSDGRSFNVSFGYKFSI
jgi:Fe(3+) dicitrate transport protein